MSDWKFDLDEVGPEAEEAEEATEPISPPVEPESPRLEHVLPFIAGIGVALFVFAQVL